MAARAYANEMLMRQIFRRKFEFDYLNLNYASVLMSFKEIILRLKL